MINPFQTNLGLADHNYCLPVSALTEEVVQKLNLEAMENGEKLMWEDAAIEFQPPSPSDHDGKSTVSSLSPAHSVDSGFDAGMESFLKDIFGKEDSSYQPFDFDFDSDFLPKDIPQPTETTTRPRNEILPPRKTPSVGKKTTHSKDEQEDIEEKNRKNAIAARENRLKKKKYVEGLEEEVRELRKDNELLKTNHERLKNTVGSLEEEVQYYKNVLENQSTLSVLINRIATTPGINFTTSFGRAGTGEAGQAGDGGFEVQEGTSGEMNNNRDGAEGTSADNTPSKRYHTRGNRKRPAESTKKDFGKKKVKKSGGICLHVSQDNVSLEMCQHCSTKASGSLE